jgi:hypothetical protein
MCYKQLAQLKHNLLTLDYIDIADATYSRGLIAFGDLQDIGAGLIERNYDINGNIEYYAFHYKSTLNDEKITASLRFGDTVLRPGESYESFY